MANSSSSSSGAQLPADAATQKLGTAPATCSLGVRPISMTGLILQLLKQHFANTESIEHDAFRSRAWSKVVCESGLVIADGTVWDPTIAGEKPSVIVKRNAFKPLTSSIGGFYDTTTEGHRRYSSMMQGSHTVFAAAKAGPEADILAAEVYLFFLHMGPVIRQYFGLHRFKLLEIGEVSILEEATTVYAVPVTVVYGWEESWVLFEHAPILKRISLSSLIPGN